MVIPVDKILVLSFMVVIIIYIVGPIRYYVMLDGKSMDDLKKLIMMNLAGKDYKRLVRHILILKDQGITINVQEALEYELRGINMDKAVNIAVRMKEQGEQLSKEEILKMVLEK